MAFLVGMNETFLYRIERSDALLAIQHVQYRFASLGFRKFRITNVFYCWQGFLSFPEDECTNGVALDDTVNQFCRLLLTPNKLTLKLRDPELPSFDTRK